MKRVVLSAVILGFVLWSQPGKAAPTGPNLPRVDGKAALAQVNGKTIFLDDLLGELSAIHEQAADNAALSRSDAMVLLDRMINARLVVQEARNIGLDELPEVKKAFRTYEQETLRAMLFGRQVLDVRKPDPKEVNRRYRAAVKEVRAASVLIEKEADAKTLEAKVRAGGDFGALAKRMIDEGAATGNPEGEYLKYRNLLPQVSRALSTVKAGQVTPLFKIGDKYTMVKLLAVRFPEDPAARKKAEGEALEAKRTAVLKAYTEGLKKKYVKVHEKLWKELDYDSPEPGFERLLKDTRIVAEVKGEKPVMVRELSEALQKRFFHGTEGAARKKRINRKKAQVLDEILFKRVTEKEARKMKIDRTPAYRNKVEENRRAVLFGVFVQKVIEPAIRLDEADLKAYLEEHADEYSSPEMMRIESLAFSERKNAEEAVEKLREGSDFQWMRANVEHRVLPGQDNGLLSFGTGLLLTEGLPEGVRKAVAGAVGGEYRLYAPPGGPYYVLYVPEVVPPAPRPFESVKGQIARRVFEKKRVVELGEYVKKLRAASDVKIYATEVELRRILRERAR